MNVEEGARVTDVVGSGSGADGPRTTATQALPRDARMVTYFQPFYNLRSDALQGFEALARRRTAEGDAPLPEGVFTAAAKLGGVRDIDLWILDDALEHMARWHEVDGQRDLILSVNLSWDLVGDPTFVTEVLRAIERHGVPGDRLLVDISTELFRRLVALDGEVLGRIGRLQEKELTFCLDGFTSDDLDLLPQAASTPVDIIKLQPGQLAGVTGAAHEDLSAISRAVQDVGLPVVAAGIETQEQLDLVRELDFEWAQGFYLGEPVDATRALACPPALRR